MGTFITNRIFIFDKTKKETKPIRLDNVNFSYTDIGENEAKYELAILTKYGELIKDTLPSNFKLVSFDDMCGTLVYLPNVVLENGKYICHDADVFNKGEKYTTSLILKNHFDFMKENDIELHKDDF